VITKALTKPADSIRVSLTALVSMKSTTEGASKPLTAFRKMKVQKPVKRGAKVAGQNSEPYAHMVFHWPWLLLTRRVF
jgi:hypothetical protein